MKVSAKLILLPNVFISRKVIISVEMASLFITDVVLLKNSSFLDFLCVLAPLFSL